MEFAHGTTSTKPKQNSPFCLRVITDYKVSKKQHREWKYTSIVGEEEWNCLAPLSSGHTVLYAIGRVSEGSVVVVVVEA